MTDPIFESPKHHPETIPVCSNQAEEDETAMMYSNARYGQFKHTGTKNRGYMEGMDFDFEIPPYEEMHFLSLDELIPPQGRQGKEPER